MRLPRRATRSIDRPRSEEARSKPAGSITSHRTTSTRVMTAWWTAGASVSTTRWTSGSSGTGMSVCAMVDGLHFAVNRGE